MKALRLSLALLCLGLASAVAAPKKVLVVTTTTGFRHSSIPTAEKVLAKLAKDSGAFTIDLVQQPGNEPRPPQKPVEPRKPAAPKPESDPLKAAQADLAHTKAMANYELELAKYKAAAELWTTREAQLQADYKKAQADWQAQMKQNLSALSADNLKNYDAVVFANTTGDLPLPDPQAFIDWVKAGHGFVGMHSASDTFHGFRPYIEMLGGEFLTHGPQVGVECLVQDSAHPATRHLGESYCIEQEEIYLLTSYNPTNVHELLVLDKHPNKKKEAGRFPIAWSRQVGDGRVFYTSLGHREDVWENKRFQQHILGGLKWALGLEKGSAAPAAR